jgi:hypothetical protein
LKRWVKVIQQGRGGWSGLLALRRWPGLAQPDFNHD